MTLLESIPRRARAGLPRLAFRFHDPGHYAVSQLIAQGVSVLQVAARVAGHADPRVTLRVYSHLLPVGSLRRRDATTRFAR